MNTNTEGTVQNTTVEQEQPANNITNEKGDTNMEAIINRLKKEREEYEDQWAKQGKEDALEEAKGMDYGDLKTYGDPEIPVHQLEDPCGAMPDWVWENIDDDLKQEGNESCYHQIDREAYARGWLLGVQEFWEQVSAHL
jgi:hypothetical protein